MKLLSYPALFALASLTAVPAVAQTRSAGATRPAATASKPAPTAAKPTASRTATKPAAAEPAPQTSTPARSTAPANSTAPKSTTQSRAGSQEFGVGTTAANLGVGFGLGYGYGLFSGIRTTPALSLSVERGIMDNVGPGVISAGGLVGFRSSTWRSGSYRASWNNFIVAARGAYHYNILEVPKLDTYAGISLGVRVESYSTNIDAYSNNYGGLSLTSGFFLGGRYMFTDNIGAFGELGYDMSLVKVGLSAKF